MSRRKIGLIGAGNIGMKLANLAVTRELGDIVLFDVPERADMARGKALDLEQASALSGSDAHVTGTADWADLNDAAVLIVTAGVPRKPGQSRDDLIAVNLPIIRDVARHAKEHCPDAFVIVVSNPLDAMVYECRRVMGAPRARVVGMAGVLDSARFSLFIARSLGVSVKDVRTMVLGGHGDDMVPLLGYCTVNGVPVPQLLPLERLNALVERTRNGGGEIVKLMGTSAYYAPAAAAIEMATAYLRDAKRVLPAAAMLEGEYGYHDLYMGVPVIIGAGGVERILEVELTPDEREMLKRSADSVRKVVDVVKRN